MLDMRLYKPSGEFTDIRRDSENMSRVLPDDPSASDIEVIAGKVVKFLLTEKGSDAFNPDYGGTSLHYLQISPAFLPQLRREVFADVDACLRFIQKAELAGEVSGERLERINIIKVHYDPKLSPNRLDVYLEIFTTRGNRAVVALKGGSGGGD